eukprot:CAMPEP_0171921804 /NCGR_PEP_ID=MMETSP0993-20121228/20639_1 /TAXON_ID=483369 /ORGANISM="non described non described, Strain CCMP2098" /LENGTH=202 /DNA_ID=CAMNT_0012559335 /DNA_START=62 /DNA_END=667 /DNA_ORIENTATION=+
MNTPLWVDIETAQRTSVAYCPGLLTQDDFACIKDAVSSILEVEDPVENNQGNAIYENKLCVILNKASTNDMLRQRCPRVLAKILRFAKNASRQQNWTAPGGPLESCGDVEDFQVRTAERWRYSVGGGLSNQTHFDHGSLLTLVSALDDGYEGGVFRTGLDADDTMNEHYMHPGDCVCFLSHKYHNVTPVVKGTRHSLVIELW